MVSLLDEKRLGLESKILLAAYKNSLLTVYLLIIVSPGIINILRPQAIT